VPPPAAGGVAPARGSWLMTRWTAARAAARLELASVGTEPDGSESDGTPAAGALLTSPAPVAVEGDSPVPRTSGGLVAATDGDLTGGIAAELDDCTDASISGTMTTTRSEGAASSEPSADGWGCSEESFVPVRLTRRQARPRRHSPTIAATLAATSNARLRARCKS